MERTAAFLKVVDYLEVSKVQVTIHDLVKKMSEFLQHTKCEPYSKIYMKTKIESNVDKSRYQFGDCSDITRKCEFNTILIS